MQFQVMSSQDLSKMSYGSVINTNLYESGQNSQKVKFGLLDQFMGICKSKDLCATCNQSYKACVGHFGHIELNLPVFHVGYFGMIVNILQQICKKCAKILLSIEQQSKYKKLLSCDIQYTERKALRKRIVAECVKIKKCKTCGEVNGVIKKTSLLEIGHVKYRHVSAKNTIPELQVLSNFSNKISTTKYKDYTINLDPLQVLNLFKKIPQYEIIFLCMNPSINDPSCLIVCQIPVSPVCIRPSILSEGRSGSREDDLTMKLTEILYINHSLNTNGGSFYTGEAREMWKNLQIKVALLVDSELSGLPFEMAKKAGSRGIIQRLKGKYGRFRGNLSGKRVDFSGRSVISPDPNLKINQVGVPRHMAKILTFPEVVNAINIASLKLAVMKGADIHPGANFLIKGENRFFLAFGKRKEMADNLKFGDVVERHLIDDDVVLFNRQPSLHKLSIQAFKAKILDHRTLRFNECCCNPFNADFDGDEMNIHVPQTYEAKAEALCLMESKKNIINQRNGEPLITAIQDFITGAYLLTHLDVLFNYKEMCQLLASFLSNDITEKEFYIPQPAIIKPFEFWTGKQIFGIMLRPYKNSNVKINLQCKNKMYKPIGVNDDFINETFCHFQNSYLISGVVDKATLGAGSKNNVFYNIFRDYGDDEAALAMWRLSRLIPFYLSNRGFSIGISDVTPSQELISEKDKLLNEGYSKCHEYIQLTKNNQLAVQPGMTEDETLESKILGELSVIRDHAGQVCLRQLHYSNGPLVMALCGSKGSNINISQMIACVGQQAISGKRTPNGFLHRSLPHFKQFDKEPAAKGFVRNSFYSGLSPTEFFFHTMAGREGLVDTAVKTAETGYMQRRLVKALEDVIVHYDGTVRNAESEIIQFIYGDDNLDPSFIENDLLPVNLQRIWTNILYTNHHYDEKCTDFENLNCYILECKRLIGTLTIFAQNVTNFLLEKAETLKLLENKPHGKKAIVERVTKSHLDEFMNVCFDKLEKAQIEPGTAIGAIGAQSIGEPATQMTLKTFHFAGVAAMNITLGVPRIKEIINASANIKTPIIECELENDWDEDFARKIKMNIERTSLGQICQYMEDSVIDEGCFILIKLHLDRIRFLRLKVTLQSIINSICETKFKKPVVIEKSHILVYDESTFAIDLNDTKKPLPHFVFKKLKFDLMNVLVKGNADINRAIINIDETSGNKKYQLLVEGSNIAAVMTTVGVVASTINSNNITQVASVLGIEAARNTIVNEIEYTMKSHGMNIDKRHVMLLAAIMTSKGSVNGMTRYGLAKMKQSVLMLASFEKTSQHLFEAAYYGQKDSIKGVSESIIMGVPIKVGTGMFSLMMDSKKIDK